MRLSVVIPCLNAADTLPPLLDALAAQDVPGGWEVIVADNGSADGTPGLARAYADRLPALQVITAADRRGAAAARNGGARVARGEHIVFIDSDDLVGEGYLSAIAGALEQHDFVASRLEIERLNEPWLAQCRPHEQTAGLMRVGYPPKLPHAAGSGLAIRRALHEAAGGFDESLRFLQDTDYCFRVQLAGTPLHFAGDAVVHMRYRSTIPGLYRQSKNWGEYNILLAKRYQSGMSAKQSARLWYNYGRRWLRLAGRLACVRGQVEWARWVRHCGWQIGLLYGSVKHRRAPI